MSEPSLTDFLLARIAEDEYRIEFAIQRRREGEDDFTEIGFGSSGAWGDLDACTHSIDSGVSNGEWETTGDMPDPDEVMADIKGRSTMSATDPTAGERVAGR